MTIEGGKGIVKADLGPDGVIAGGFVDVVAVDMETPLDLSAGEVRDNNFKVHVVKTRT